MPESLWRNSDFLKLWVSQAVSHAGTQIRLLALPLTAILTLDATPLQVGLLFSIGGLPSLLIGLIAGAYVDRHRRRVILIAADWGRAVIIGMVPAAYFFDVLHLWMLFVAAFGMGTLSLVFEIANRSYLPSLVDRTQLVEGNSKLEIGRSGAEIAGPSIGGGIIQLASAPVALLVDAASFAVSALFLHRIRKPEAAPERPTTSDSLFKDAANGLRFAWASRLMRPLVIATASLGFFNAILEAASLLYMSDELDINAGLIGLIFGLGSIGLLVGATAASYLTARFGIGPVIVAALLLIAVSDLALPLAGGPIWVIVLLLMAAQVAFGIGLTLFSISQVSLRQSVAEDRMLGRLTAVFQLAFVGTIPLGALVGGLIGEYIGLREALFVGIAGEVVAVTWLLASPVRSLRNLPKAGADS